MQAKIAQGRFHRFISSDFSPAMAIATLAVASVMLFGYLVFRTIGLGPSVFGDEWTYSEFARLTPLRKTGIPSFLFSTIFRTTSTCGTSFLECARVLNVFWFVAAMPLIYGVASRFTPRRVAVVIAILSLLGPVSTYTALFMPESLYFTTFWLFVFAATRDRDSRGYAFGVGAALGVMALVKVHAFALVPGFLVVLVLDWMVTAPRGPVARLVKDSLALGLGFVALRFLGGWILAGKVSFDIVGTFYRTQAERLPPKSIVETGLQSLEVLLHHVEVVGLLLGLGVAALLIGVLHWPRAQSTAAQRKAWRFYLFALVVLGVVLTMTSYFTAAVVSNGASETLGRLHMRYYGFALPLLYIAAAAQAHTALGGFRASQWLRMAITIVVGALAIYGATIGLQDVVQSRIDNPEYVGWLANHRFHLLCLTLGAACLALYLFKPVVALRVFVFVYLPVYLLGAGLVVARWSSARINGDDYDTAGKVVQLVLGKSTSGLVIYGGGDVSLIKMKFYIDDKTVRYAVLSPGQPVDHSVALPDVKTVAIVGDHEMKLPYAFLRRFGNLNIYQIEKFPPIDFRAGSYPDPVDSVRGVSLPEPSGRWSDDDQVVIAFSRPLPPRFTLHLVASAFGPNIGKPIAITAGSSTASVVLDSGVHEVAVELSPERSTQELRIAVPVAISPHDLGVGEDARRLGIMLERITIVGEDTPAQLP